MKKIHQVNYGDIFGRQFKTSKIDQRLDDLEIDEKLMIIDNVIDYLQENFKELSPSKKNRSSSRRLSPDRQHQQQPYDNHRDEDAYQDTTDTDQNETAADARNQGGSANDLSAK